MKRGTITLVLPKQSTEDEIKAIRALYNTYGYTVNLVISGNEPFIDNLQEFLKATKK